MGRITRKQNGSGKITSTLISLPLSLVRKLDLLDRELNIYECNDGILITPSNSTYADSNDMELHIMCMIYKTFKDENILLELEKFINALWTIRTGLQKSIIGYDLHFALYNYFEKKYTSFTISTVTKDVIFDMKEKTIEIESRETNKSCKIYVSENMSDELSEYICDFYFDDEHKLDLNKLTEKYEINQIEFFSLI